MPGALPTDSAGRYSLTVSQKQFVIMSRSSSSGNSLQLLGGRNEIVRKLSIWNTAPETEGDDVLHGPGFSIELPPGQETVQQMLMTIIEEEIAWQVIMRVAKKFDWKIIDTESGRELNA